jgi:fatty-acyl-CoA synthase
MAEIAEKVCETIDTVSDMVFLNDLIDRATAEGGVDTLPDVTPEDPAQIQYTSGTTGFPKGALLHHRGLVNSALHQQQIIGFKKGTRAITMMPMFHCSGCGLAVLGAVQSLSTNIIVTTFIPAAVNRLAEEERVNLLFGVPTMLIALLEDFDRNPRDFSNLTHSGSGGSMVPPDLVRRIKSTWSCAFITVYGQTETSPLITMTRPNDTHEDIAGTIGQPMPQIEVAIRHPETGAIMPLDQQGEINTRGYLNMIGYNKNPEATAQTIDKDGWLRTGDLGTMDARGYVKITGRVKEMIIRGGENLFPAEIENCLLEHADVAEIAIVGLPDDKWGEVVGAFIRLNEGASADAVDLKAHCRAHISPQKTPTEWHFVTEFPLTGSGKIKRFELRDIWLEGGFS